MLFMHFYFITENQLFADTGKNVLFLISMKYIPFLFGNQACADSLIPQFINLHFALKHIRHIRRYNLFPNCPVNKTVRRADKLAAVV